MKNTVQPGQFYSEECVQFNYENGTTPNELRTVYVFTTTNSGISAWDFVRGAIRNFSYKYMYDGRLVPVKDIKFINLSEMPSCFDSETIEKALQKDRYKTLTHNGYVIGVKITPEQPSVRIENGTICIGKIFRMATSDGQLYAYGKQIKTEKDFVDVVKKVFSLQ